MRAHALVVGFVVVSERQRNVAPHLVAERHAPPAHRLPSAIDDAFTVAAQDAARDDGIVGGGAGQGARWAGRAARRRRRERGPLRHPAVVSWATNAAAISAARPAETGTDDGHIL